MDVNQQALLELLKASLFGIEPALPDEVDWVAVFEEALAQTVIALAAPAVPEEHAPQWSERVSQNTAHYMRVLYEQTRLTRLFETAGIPMAILKGSSAAMYYPVPAQRTMGDIDFLVPPVRFDEARKILENSGYAFQGDYGDDRDYTYYRGGVVFELHRRYSDADWDIEAIILDGLSRAETREINANRFSALPDEVNGLILLDHVRHHLYGGLGIRQIIDWMMFVRAVLTDAYWEETFYPLAREAGLDTLAISMTKMCRLWLGLPDAVTWCGAADEATARQLLETVMHSGNFGRKDPYVYRPMESATMGIKEQGFFRFLQNTGLANWKAAQKCAFLRMFAWLYQLLRFIGKGIAALFRGANFRKDISDGAEKNDFYGRLGIVEKESPPPR